jgi:hypothetical protein
MATDNEITQSSAVASISSGVTVALYKTAFSGDTNAAVAPTVLWHMEGSESTWTFAQLSVAEDSTSSPNPRGIQMMITRNDNPTISPGTDANGDHVAVRGTPFGSPYVTLVNSAGVEAYGVRDDPASITAPVVYAGVIRRDAATSPVSADGDASVMTQDSNGYLRVVGPPGIQTFVAKSTVTWTLTSLGTGESREMTAFDNSTLGAIDFACRLRTKGTAASTGLFTIYLYEGLSDTSYSDGATGTDSTFTSTLLVNSTPLTTVRMRTTGSVTKVWHLSDVLKGAMPSKFGFIGTNDSAGALSSTAADHALHIEPIY